MQQKSDIKLYWPKIEAFKRKSYLTWPAVAKIVGVSVAMLMMVKTGKRNLSQKALDRFDAAAREAGMDALDVQLRHLGAWQTGFSSGDRVKVSRSEMKRGYLIRPVDYKLADPGPEYPKEIRLSAVPPSDAAHLLPHIDDKGGGYDLFYCKSGSNETKGRSY